MGSALAWEKRHKQSTNKKSVLARSFVIGLFYAKGG